MPVSASRIAWVTPWKISPMLLAATKKPTYGPNISGIARDTKATSPSPPAGPITEVAADGGLQMGLDVADA
jgi:hypothetical protein